MSTAAIRSRRLKIRLLVSVLVLLCGPFGVFLEAHDELEDQVEQATQRIGREPRNADLLVKRGELYRQLRRWQDALADYDRARTLDPALTEIPFYRARLWLEAGRPRDARLELDSYLKTQPDHVEALITRAKASAALKDYRPSIVDYTRAIDLSPRPNPDSYIERAAIQELAGLADEAIGGLDGGIAKLGSLVGLETHAIEIEVRLKRWDAALARVERIAAQSPRKESHHERRGQILLQAGRRNEARAAFSDALKAVEALPPRLRQTKAMADLEQRIRAALR
jgi:tetratricopeptide (TPR) repeat protein